MRHFYYVSVMQAFNNIQSFVHRNNSIYQKYKLIGFKTLQLSFFRDWSGWDEQIDNIFYCLFCQTSYHNMENIQLHMQVFFWNILCNSHYSSVFTTYFVLSDIIYISGSQTFNLFYAAVPYNILLRIRAPWEGWIILW